MKRPQSREAARWLKATALQCVRVLGLKFRIELSSRKFSETLLSVQLYSRLTNCQLHILFINIVYHSNFTKISRIIAMDNCVHRPGAGPVRLMIRLLNGSPHIDSYKDEALMIRLLNGLPHIDSYKDEALMIRLLDGLPHIDYKD
jgi:hypothetical protein